jgi:hypothetical protein
MSFFKQNGLPEDIYYCLQRIYRDLRQEAVILSPFRTRGLIQDIESVYRPETAELIKKANLGDLFFGEFSIPKLTILYGHEKVVPVLKKLNVDLEETQADGHTLASIACMTGRIPMLKALHDAGVDLTSPDFNGDTPMIWAMPEHGTYAALVELIKGKTAGDEYVRNLKEKILSTFTYFSSSDSIGDREKARRLDELRFNVQEFYSPYISMRREELGIDDLVPGSGDLTIKNKVQEPPYNNHVGFIFFDINPTQTSQVLEHSIQDGPALP